MKKMSVGRGKTSPARKSVGPWRPGSAKRVIGRTAAPSVLNKAAKTLSTVALDSATQRGNIKVVVRVRPLNSRENVVNLRQVVHAIDSHMVVFDPPDDETPDFYYRGVKQSYYQKVRHKNVKLAFDNVYGPLSTNSEIFTDVINPMLDNLLNGFNCSVFAYGATGAGKTHTMLGSVDNPGLTFLTVMELYKRLEVMDNDFETEVAVSYLEVYNETVKDLLHSSGDLNIREDANGVVVPNLTNHKPKDANELLNLLAFGNSVRSQHPTDHNAESSRSHAVFQVYVSLRSRFTELTSKYKSAKFVMVDLAGSERGAATGFHGQRFREGASINKSLLSLGNCINALADGKKHIPYRDSKLTRILKDVLGGNCKTVMIANVSPAAAAYDDSYNTLRYADRAKRIKCQVKKNTLSVNACLTQYKKVVEEMSLKIEQLQAEVAEYQKNYRCIRPTSDASTVTESELNFSQTTVETKTKHHSPCMDRCPGLPQNIMASYSDLLQRKQDALRILCEASASATSAAVKISVKERRILSISKFSSIGMRTVEDKNSSKIRRQIGPLKRRLSEALCKKAKALQVIEQLDGHLENLLEENSHLLNSGCVPLKFSEFVNLMEYKVGNFKAEQLKNFYKQNSLFFANEWQRGEMILGKSVEVLQSNYLITKHYGRNTRLMDHEHEELVASMCGTKVHWFSDVTENEMETSIVPLMDLLDEDLFFSEKDINLEEHMQVDPLDKTYNKSFRRPLTPPPTSRRMDTSADDESTMYDEDDENCNTLPSFFSETSVLNDIANCNNKNLIINLHGKDVEGVDLVEQETEAIEAHFSESPVTSLNNTITLYYSDDICAPDPQPRVTSTPLKSFGPILNIPPATICANANDSSNDDVYSETSAPIPCFLSSKAQYLPFVLEDELLKIDFKENADPYK